MMENKTKIDLKNKAFLSAGVAGSWFQPCKAVALHSGGVKVVVWTT